MLRLKCECGRMVAIGQKCKKCGRKMKGIMTDEEIVDARERGWKVREIIEENGGQETRCIRVLKDAGLSNPNKTKGVSR